MYPSYIDSNGNTSFSTIDQQFSTIYQQLMTSFGFYNNETPNLMNTDMHSTMDNSNYNNGNFLAADDGNRFKSHVILENNCLKRKNTSSTKDRHTKINTARGLKDRRMRLSLDVAKKFFRLQDLLGFDKASNTIQWLLMKSQSAIQDLRPQQLNQIDELMGASNRPSSGSQCEVVSVVDDQSCNEKKRFDNGVRKIIREKARERARKRTTVKKSIKLGGDGESCDQYLKHKPSVDRVMDQNTNRLGIWVPFEEDQVHLASNFQFKNGINVGDSSFLMSSNWSPSFLYNNYHNMGPSHEILGKQREDINN